MAEESNPQEPLPAVQESIGASHSPQASVHAPSTAMGAPMPEARRPRQYDKLRKNGAMDFRGTTDPMEAERWLRSTERIFEQMEYTPEERLDYAVSLLQDDAYDWWETVPNSTVRPWVLTYMDFLQVLNFANAKPYVYTYSHVK